MDGSLCVESERRLERNLYDITRLLKLGRMARRKRIVRIGSINRRGPLEFIIYVSIDSSMFLVEFRLNTVFDS